MPKLQYGKQQAVTLMMLGVRLGRSSTSDQLRERQPEKPGVALDDAYQARQGVSEDPRGPRRCGINH